MLKLYIKFESINVTCQRDDGIAFYPDVMQADLVYIVLSASITTAYLQGVLKIFHNRITISILYFNLSTHSC